MAMWNRKLATEFGNRLREVIARTVRENRLDLARLPRYVESAAIRIGWKSQTLVCVVEDAGAPSEEYIGDFQSDTTVLLRTRDFNPTKCVHPNFPRHVTLAQWIGEAPCVFELVSSACFVGVQAGLPIGPLLLLDIGLTHLSPPPVEVPLARRAIPLCVYSSFEDAKGEELWNWIHDRVGMYLREVTESSAGNRFQVIHSLARQHQVSKERSVLVLGGYRPDLLRDLESVRDSIDPRKYSPVLISQIQDLPSASNRDKVRFWSAAARFCVVIDDQPSGHIDELNILQDNRTITAILRPRGRSSSQMLDSDPSQYYLFMRSFAYERSPLEALSPALSWAEAKARETRR